MKNRKILIFLLGTICGIIIGIVVNYLTPKENNYVKLKKDYCIENIGIIKKGSILKFDKAFSEGFSRYILYVNIHDAEDLDKHQTDKQGMVIPYWLREIDTTCTNRSK